MGTALAPPPVYSLPPPPTTTVPDIAEQRRQLERNLNLPSHDRPSLLPPIQEKVQFGQKIVTPIQERIINRTPVRDIDSGGGGSLGLKWAFQGGTGGAATPLINEMNGEFSWYMAGLIDNLFGGGKVLLEHADPNLAQESFYSSGEGAAIAIKQIPPVIQDALSKIPHFEIPTIKIPKFDMPGLPDIFKPKPPTPTPQKDPPPNPNPQQEPDLIPKPQPQPQPREEDIPRPEQPRIPADEWQRIKEWIEEGESCRFSFSIAQSVFYKNGVVVHREPGIVSGFGASGSMCRKKERCKC